MFHHCYCGSTARSVQLWLPLGGEGRVSERAGLIRQIVKVCRMCGLPMKTEKGDASSCATSSCWFQRVNVVRMLFC